MAGRGNHVHNQSYRCSIMRLLRSNQTLHTRMEGLRYTSVRLSRKYFFIYVLMIFLSVEQAVIITKKEGSLQPLSFFINCHKTGVNLPEIFSSNQNISITINGGKNLV